jgi:hypothetical protein
MKKKVVYNACHGGFSMSKLAAMWLASKGLDEAAEFLALGPEHWGSYECCFYPYTLERHSALLSECVETLGSDRASGDMSNLVIEEVEGPYQIQEYDGWEKIVTPQDMVWKNTEDPDIVESQIKWYSKHENHEET